MNVSQQFYNSDVYIPTLYFHLSPKTQTHANTHTVTGFINHAIAKKFKMYEL